MRILILNWKDIKHPHAGGAEIVTHEFAKRLVQLGHTVYLFCQKSHQLKSEETIDGIHVCRQGSYLSVYFWAVWLYRKRFKNTIDIVIDQFHGLPFFTPLYVKKPILAYIHEVAGEIWFADFIFPLSLIGYFIEKLQFRLYQNICFLTHSISTKKELITYGIAQQNVTVIIPTIARVSHRSYQKSEHPALIYLGRLGPIKRIELLVKSVSILKKSFPKLGVWLVGSGKPGYTRQLLHQIDTLKLKHIITLFGHVSEAKKRALLKRAWINVHPSLKEGFGLTVVEAAALETPTVSFDVGGLRDLIRHNKTGILVKSHTPQALAEAIEELFSTPKKLDSLSAEAYKWSQTLPTWSKQTQKFETLLKNNLLATFLYQTFKEP